MYWCQCISYSNQSTWNHSPHVLHLQWDGSIPFPDRGLYLPDRCQVKLPLFHSFPFVRTSKIDERKVEWGFVPCCAEVVRPRTFFVFPKTLYPLYPTSRFPDLDARIDAPTFLMTFHTRTVDCRQKLLLSRLCAIGSRLLRQNGRHFDTESKKSVSYSSICEHFFHWMSWRGHSFWEVL